MSDTPISKLCRNFATTIVLGLGGTTVRDGLNGARALRETIFGLDYDSDKLIVLTNLSTLVEEMFDKRDDELVKIIKDNIMKYTSTQCDKISLVMFGHSHGAKMVMIALEELKSEKKKEEMDRIQSKMALVTLGGVSFATPDMANVVLNVDSENDLHSKAAVKIKIGNHDADCMIVGPILKSKCQCCQKGKPKTENPSSSGGLFGKDPRAMEEQSGFLSGCFGFINSHTRKTPQKETNIDDGKTEITTTDGWKFGEVQGSSQEKGQKMSELKFWVKFLPMISQVTGIQGHLIEQYACCKRWRLHLRKLLDVNSNSIDSCSCPND